MKRCNQGARIFVLVIFLISQFFISNFNLAVAQTTTLEFNPNFQISTTSSSTAAANISALQAQLQSKNQELEQINQQIEAVNQQLMITQSAGQTLKNQINNYNYQINALKLELQADQISIQKINLEIQSTKYDIDDIQNSIALKKQAIIDIFKKLQHQGNDSLLVILLKSSNISDVVSEIQNLKDLDYSLKTDVANLSSLSDSLNSKIDTLNQNQQNLQLESENLKYRAQIIAQQNAEKQNLLAITKNQESIYANLMDQLQKKQAEISNEVEAIDSILRTKIDPSLLPAPGPDVLGWPVHGIITQGYGATHFAQTAYHSKWHPGIDISAPIGTPVLAAQDGTVIASENQDLYCYHEGYGKFIVINGTNNLTTLYAHLSVSVVTKGEFVKRGQLIGYSGRTGYATGPHVHFGVYAEPTFYMGPSKSCGLMPYGGDLNPLSYLSTP
jgi:murein DD-endopeptidase MepM/ murein hydrolase activator NlpD